MSGRRSRSAGSVDPSRVQSNSRSDFRFAVVVLAFAGILGSLVQTLIIPVLAQLPVLLDTSVAGASWVVTVTLLTGAVVTPISGRLGDTYGRRRVLMICVASLLVGSVICALTSDLSVLIIGRALQGMATSVVPLGMSILRNMLEPARLPVAIAMVSAAAGVGGSVGLPLAAVVAEYLDWHLLFWACAAVAAISIVLIAVVVPRDTVSRPRARAGFDYVGAVLLAALLTCMLTAITMAPKWGWADPRITGMFTATVLMVVIFYLYERRARQPLVNMPLFLSRSILSLNVVTVFTGFGMMAMSLILTRLIQAPTSTGYGLGLSITMTGLCLAPGGVIMLMCPPVAAALAARRGSKLPLVIGIVVMTGSYAIAAVIPYTTAVVVVVGALNAAGLALVLASVPALMMQAAPAAETAAANGQNALMRTVGTATSSAVVAMIMSATVSAQAPDFSTEGGIRTAFAVGGLVCLAALVATLSVPQAHPTAGRRSTADELDRRVG
ncbi:drug resistance protein [Clostridioides difficile]|nr:drug resistance protein [Clostridioides difficile]